MKSTADICEKLITEIRDNGFVPRNLMDADEIKIAERLVQTGILYKGQTDEKKSHVAYYVNEAKAKGVSNGKD